MAVLPPACRRVGSRRPPADPGASNARSTAPTAPTGSPNLATAAPDSNGPWHRRPAQDQRSRAGPPPPPGTPSAAPRGSATPSASRTRPASSTAIHRGSPAIRTGTIRRSTSSARIHGRRVLRRSAAAISSSVRSPEAPEHVVQRIGVPHPALGLQVLQLGLDRRDRPRIE